MSISKANSEVHVFYKKIDISKTENIEKSCEKPQIIGRKLTKKEMEDIKALCLGVAIDYSNSSRKNNKIGIGLPIGKNVLDDSDEFTFFEDTFQHAKASKGKTSGKGRDTWLNGWQEYYENSLEMLDRVEILDLNIRVSGNMAATTFVDKSVFQLVGDEKIYTGFRNVTLVWLYREKEKKWKAFHEHATAGKY